MYTDEEMIYRIYGGRENMKKLVVLTPCQTRGIQMSKLRTYLSWTNERESDTERRQHELAELELLESTCDDPNHEANQKYYSEN